MKYSIDVNVFLYAADADSPHHSKCLRFLEKKVAERGDCYLLWDTVYSFLRLSTHPSIFGDPLSHQQAVSNISNAIEALNSTQLSPDSISWDIYNRLATEQPIKGKLVPDAVLASVLEANGIVKLYTRDRDFWKFPCLRPQDPCIEPK